MTARLHADYRDRVVPSLKQKLGRDNPHAIPRLQKIVVSMGVGKASQDRKFLEETVEHLTQITGQKPLRTRSRKAVSAFRLRENLEIGCCVTLRGTRMYEFLDRLIALALPRVRDFRGISGKAFDGRGNYTVGLRDQLIFPEIDFGKIDKARGMNVCIVTTAKTDEEARSLLRHLGMPFRQ